MPSKVGSRSGRIVSLALARLARGPRLAPLPAIAFADALAARHAGNTLATTPLERVLALPHPQEIAQAFHRHLHLAFAPRLGLQLAAGPALPARGAPTASPARILVEAAEPAPRFTSEVLERVIARAQRTPQFGEGTAQRDVTHAFAPSAPPASMEAAPSPFGPSRSGALAPVVRVVQRVQATAAPPPDAADAAAPERSHRSGARTPEPLAAAPHWPEPELGRLAERVAGVIGRRALALRERLGRT